MADLASEKNSLFLGITETWCHSEVLDAELVNNFPGYSVYRKDRETREGGGVCLFLRDDLTGEVLGSFDNGVCCMIICRVHQLNSTICVAYRPPNSKFQEFIDMLRSMDVILKDFHKPGEKWVILISQSK